MAGKHMLLGCLACAGLLSIVNTSGGNGIAEVSFPHLKEATTRCSRWERGCNNNTHTLSIRRTCTFLASSRDTVERIVSCSVL